MRCAARLLSCYRAPAGDRLSIITGWDRPVNGACRVPNSATDEHMFVAN